MTTMHDSWVVLLPFTGIQAFMLLVVGAFFVAAVLFYRSDRRAHAMVFVVGTGGELLFQLWQFFLPIFGTRGITLEEPSDWAIHQGISLVCWGLMAYGLIAIAYVNFRRRTLEKPDEADRR